MLARVSETIARFRMCRPGDRVGVACSGGPDSVALLETLLELAPGLQIRLGIVHLNHKLRGAASDADEAFVRALAAKHGLAAHVRSVDVGAQVEAEGGNLEEAGRAARYSWFAELVAGGAFDRIATGHTRSDQAETVLFRLLRGAGPEGLGAIRALRDPGVIRPLLEVERADVDDYLRRRGLAFRLDESNLDPRFARNRIRRDVIPALERDWNPQITAALARLADQAVEDADYWRGAVERCEERLLSEGRAGLVFRIDQVAALEPALRRRLLRRALERVGGQGRYDFQHVAALRRLVEDSDSGARLSLPGVAAERSCGRVRLTTAGHASAASEVHCAPLAPPDERHAPDGRTRIRIEVPPPASSVGSYTKPNWDRVDWSKAPKPLILRSWRPGDRICLDPGAAPSKLADLLQSAEVAVWDRVQWPVLAAARDQDASEAGILWARGFGVSSEFRPSGNIGEVMRVFEFDEAGRPWTGPESWDVISAGLS